MNVSDLVLLASRLDGSSVRLSIPVILSGPPYPTQLGLPAPASVTLNLAGCFACISLANTSSVYLSNLHLTGLERPVNSSSNSSSGSSSNGMWAFQFNRSSSSNHSSSSVWVSLHNVTLTLPRQEFRTLLAGVVLANVSGSGTAGKGGQLQSAGGWSFQVRAGPRG